MRAYVSGRGRITQVEHNQGGCRMGDIGMPTYDGAHKQTVTVVFEVREGQAEEMARYGMLVNVEVSGEVEGEVGRLQRENASLKRELTALRKSYSETFNRLADIKTKVQQA